MQALGSRGLAHTENEMDEEDPTQGIPDWLQPFTENLEDLETHVPAHPSEREISDSEGDASKVETQKRKHRICTHFPKDWNCDRCLRTQITRVPCRRRNEGSIPRAENFGALITADHKVLNEGCESRNNHRYAVVVQDLATQFLSVQNKHLSGDGKEFTEVSRAVTKAKSYLFGQFIGIWQILWRSIMESSNVYSWSLRNKRNCRTNYTTSKREGSSAVLLQSGLDDKWWSDSMECFCYLRNVQDLLADGKTPYERRFGESFKGPVIPSGALVEYLPNSESDKARIHQFGKKVLQGIFLGYALIAGGIWKGDILVADIEEFGRIRNLSQKTECKRSPDNSQKTENVYFLWQMVQQHYQEETTNSKNSLWDGNTP